MKTKRRHYKTQPSVCDPAMKFEECELAILRNAIDEAEQKNAEKMVNGPEIKKIMEIVEDFLIRKKVVCYGGTAINNILPREAQFYDRAVDIPDYDFFSLNALADAKELADIYFAAGYEDVEAKSGVHKGTYKVYVNFIPVADITFMEKTIFKEIYRESVVVGGIHYCPPNWLRMGMYLELSRPMGDITRWEKVLTRLTLLNRHFPLKTNLDCVRRDFQRGVENYSEEDAEHIYNIIHDTFINQDVVFFGGFAMSLYSDYMSPGHKSAVKKVADFDVLSEDPKRVADIVVEQLKLGGFKAAAVKEHPEAGEFLPKHYEIRVGVETFAFIYEPKECVNYNKINVNRQTLKIATIDTILRYYLVFLYTGRAYYDKERLICMAHFLFLVQQRNRLAQRGILRRFTMDCIGKQQTLEDIRAEKAAQFKRLRGKKSDPEYERWFLKYAPGLEHKGKKEDKEKKESVVATASTTPKDAAKRKRRKTRRKRRAAAAAAKYEFMW